MTPLLTILASATLAIAVQMQEQTKPSAEQKLPTEKQKVEKKKIKAAKDNEIRKADFDPNFRAQEERTRMAINTLGGKLVAPGKKRGEGC